MSTFGFQTAACRLQLAVLFGVSVIAGHCSGQEIYSNDFDQHTSSRKYRVSDLNAEWNSPEWNDGVSEGRVRIERGSNAFGGTGACLVVKYPEGKHGTNNTGAQWKMDLGGNYEEVKVTYRVKFKKYFDFVKGGKLPGLAGGTSPTGTTAATGYNGWAGRMMWITGHTGDPGSPKQKTSGMISYAKYYQSGYDGDGKDEDKTDFTVGGKGDSPIEIDSNRWYKITQRIKMNSPSSSNGIIQIWLDNKLVVNQKNIRFRKTSKLGIDQFYFSTFFGGGYSWRTSRYSTVYFDDFSIVAVE